MSLEKLLGRKLPAEERGTIVTLNELPEPLLDQARELARRSRLGAVELLQFYVVRSELDHVAAFVEEVIYGSEEPATWGWFDALCVPSIPVEDALVSDAETILTNLAAIEGERWWRIEPTRSEWEGSGATGAPGVVVRRVPYFWSGSPEIDWIRLSDELVTPVPDVAIAVRRWIASRVAWDGRVSRAAEQLVSVHTICSAMGIDEARLSADGRLALEGLAREMVASSAGSPSVCGDDGPDGIPGFRGPDDWYRSATAVDRDDGKQSA
jgi:hypothetical protein